VITGQEDNLVLNVVPVTFEAEKLIIGRMPNVSKDEYQKLQDAHWKTHSFRFDRRTDEILNVSIEPNAKPLGIVDEVNPQDHLLLIARAIQQNILVWLSSSLPILRGNKKLMFWGQADSALLLTRALEKIGAEKIKGLEVTLRYEIDCRMFQHDDEERYLGLVLDLSTSNIIELPVPELLHKGLMIDGRCVCRRQPLSQEYLQPKLELLGQVSAIKGTKLLLTETEGVNEISADDILLEPRLENLNDVIKLYYGPKADAVLSSLDSFRKPISTAAGKLARLKETLRGLKKRSIIIANNVTINLGNLLQSSDAKFPSRVKTERPNLLFGPQGRNHSPYPDPGVTSYGPYMYMQHERNAPLMGIVCASRYRGRVEQFIQLLRDGFPQEEWRNERKGNPFQQGMIGKYRLSNFRVEYEECKNDTPEAYKEAVNRLLLRLPEPPDIALIQIKESFSKLYGNFNPYFVSKAACMMAGVPVQAIRIEKIEFRGESLAYLLNSIALAIYAKFDGIPWVMSTYRPTTHEIVFGIGSAEVGSGRFSDKTRYVGITSVFQGDGRYLLWGVTREVEFEKYSDALLQSLKAVVSYVQQHNVWQEGDKVRLVCHVYKPLRDREVSAIKDLVKDLIADKFDVEFAFLDISLYHSYQLFAPAERGVRYWDFSSRSHKIKGKGVPQRGIGLLLDDSRGLLQLAGPNELKTDTQGNPKPLLIELHRDSDFNDMTYLMRQVYNFTYMSWRSFMPSTEPVTISYSRLIARLLGNLKQVSEWNSQVLSVGSLRDRRWFL
jgi:Piwi domain